jgi:hypothetical protein
VNVEVTAVEEKENEEKKEESCTECEVVELGVVSTDTLGGYGAYFYDGGVNYRTF